MLTKLKSAVLTKSSPVSECPQKKKKATSLSSIAIVELYPSLHIGIQPIIVSVCMSQLLQGDPSWSCRAASKFGGSEVAQRAALGGRAMRSEVVMSVYR